MKNTSVRIRSSLGESETDVLRNIQCSLLARLRPDQTGPFKFYCTLHLVPGTFTIRIRRLLWETDVEFVL